MRLAISLVVCIAGAIAAHPAIAQQTSAVTANQLRLDLRLLGHPPVDVIPPGESAITSLTVGSDGFLYGGTSGARAHLFQLDPKWGHVYPLGFLPGEESIFHSLAAGEDGAIYIGTSLVNVGAADSRGRDVLERYEGYSGGHLYRFDAAEERQARRRMQHPRPDEPLGFYEDLGVPIPGQGIVHLLAAGRKLFGVTFPDGHFFVTDLETGETDDKGAICGPPLNEEPFRSIPRAMVVDGDGLVWGAGDYGALFHYDPAEDTTTHHPELRLPSELGREFKTILDAMVVAPDGTIYGGTSDGFLFRFDPASPKVINLGKPMWQYRIRGLAFSQEGDLYGVGGEPGGAARLFVYRTADGGYENLGLLDVNRSPYYAWLAFEADSMLAGPDGTIFIGESGRISHLYLLYPWR
jgi:sugar lactone lactonase YvrE